MCAAATCSDGVRNGNELGQDCGGTNTGCAGGCPSLLFLGTSPTGTFAASYVVAAGTWGGAQALSATSPDRPALVTTSAGQGVGLIRVTTSNELHFTTWSTSTGVWGAFASIGGATPTAQAAPALASQGAGAQSAYLTPTFAYHYASYNGAAWTITAEDTTSTGGSAPAIVTTATGAVLADVEGLTDELRVRTRAAGAWGATETLIGVTDSVNEAIGPRLIALTSGTDDLMVVFLDKASTQVKFSLRDSGNGMWSMPANITGATTPDRPALLPLAAGGALLAIRGDDGNLHALTYSGMGWSAPVQITTTILGAPELAPGKGTATAEVVYVDADGVGYHSRLIAGAWSATPVAIGGTALVGVAIASTP